MSNFEYIIASLPYLTADYRYADGQGFGDVVAEIRENLSERDAAEMDFLLKGFDGDALDADFYAEALSKGNRFLRDYFRFDLNLRNAKVRYLNRALGREPDRDVLTGEGKEEDRDLDIDGFRFRAGEFDEAAKVEAVLEGKDLLTRERGLDDIVWEKVDALSTFHYFDLTAVLAYLCKLRIANRWLALDEEAGRRLFKKLVDEVRGTFKGVKYEEK